MFKIHVEMDLKIKARLSVYNVKQYVYNKYFYTKLYFIESYSLPATVSTCKVKSRPVKHN